jgi:hypothetical protein
MKNLSVYKKNNPNLDNYKPAAIILALFSLPTVFLENKVIFLTFVCFALFIFNIYFELLPKYEVNRKKMFIHDIDKSKLKSCRIDFEKELSQLLSIFVQINRRYQVIKPKYDDFHVDDFFSQTWITRIDEKKFAEIIKAFRIGTMGVSKRSDFVINQVCNKWEFILETYSPKNLYLIGIMQNQILLSLGYTNDRLAQSTFLDSLKFLLEDCLEYKLVKNKIEPVNNHDTLSETVFAQLIEISVIGLTKEQIEKLKNFFEFTLLSQNGQVIPSNMFDIFKLAYNSDYGLEYCLGGIRTLDYAKGVFQKQDEDTLRFKESVHDLVDKIFPFVILESYWESENRELAVNH